MGNDPRFAQSWTTITASMTNDSPTFNPPMEPVSSPVRSNLPIVVISALFILIFAPSLFQDFGIFNDYWIWSYNHHQCCIYFPETSHLFWIGRPLGALLLNLHFLWFDKARDLSVGRAVSLLFLMGTLGIAATLFQRSLNVGRHTAWALSTLVFLLPASLLYVLWLTNFVPGTLNVFLATLAYFLVDRSYSAHRVSKRRLLAAFGYSLLLLSFYIYPPTSYFFLVFTAARVVFSAGEE